MLAHLQTTIIWCHRFLRDVVTTTSRLLSQISARCAHNNQQTPVTWCHRFLCDMCSQQPADCCHMISLTSQSCLWQQRPSCICHMPSQHYTIIKMYPQQNKYSTYLYKFLSVILNHWINQSINKSLITIINQSINQQYKTSLLWHNLQHRLFVLIALYSQR